MTAVNGVLKVLAAIIVCTPGAVVAYSIFRLFIAQHTPEIALYNEVVVKQTTEQQMENIILLLAFLSVLCGVLALGSFIVETVIKYRERKFHKRVMAKVLTLR